MGYFLSFLFGVFCLPAGIIFYNTFIKGPKFKVGDIVVCRGSESWDSSREEYLILAIGDNNYQVKLLENEWSSNDRLYGRLKFDAEDQYKVKK